MEGILKKLFQFSIGDAAQRAGLQPRRSAGRFNSLLEMHALSLVRYDGALMIDWFQFSIGDARKHQRREALHATSQRFNSLLEMLCGAMESSNTAETRFNSLLEMLGLVEFWMCGFLSFLSVFWLGGAWLGCVGCCVLSIGKVCWVCRCVYLRVFSPRRRHVPGSCTTFYKLDLRFTKPTRRRSRTIRQR